MNERLTQLLERIVKTGCVPEDEFRFDGIVPEKFGLQVKDGLVVVPAELELLDQDGIARQLSPAAAAWLRQLKVFVAVDSTNTRMTEEAQSASVGGYAWVAEVQLAGRGRRGRHWMTPFGTNIALTLGFGFGRPLGRLGGLSLAVGLAVAQLLHSKGVVDVAVKWPNDVYVGDAKICGILIEVVTRVGECDCIVGIGLNLDLPEGVRAAIGREVTDLKAAGLCVGRNEIVADLMGEVVQVVSRFKRDGFAPLRAAYDNLHLCHDKPCRITQGEQFYEGVVLGLSDAGALRVQCAERVIEFTGGEVSLRKQDAGEMPANRA